MVPAGLYLSWLCAGAVSASWRSCSARTLLHFRKLWPCAIVRYLHMIGGNRLEEMWDYAASTCVMQLFCVQMMRTLPEVVLCMCQCRVG